MLFQGRIDFAENDAANRKLAKLGEQFVYDVERHRLNQAGQDDLVLKVHWVAQTIGDGLGFDSLSFDEAKMTPSGCWKSRRPALASSSRFM